jgi:hypothetical protein
VPSSHGTVQPRARRQEVSTFRLSHLSIAAHGDAAHDDLARPPLVAGDLAVVVGEPSSCTARRRRSSVERVAVDPHLLAHRGIVSGA